MDPSDEVLDDLRRVFIAYLRNHNARLRPHGRLRFVDHGLLTYDGIHPTDLGNELLAAHIADGIPRGIRASD